MELYFYKYFIAHFIALNCFFSASDLMETVRGFLKSILSLYLRLLVLQKKEITLTSTD